MRARGRYHRQRCDTGSGNTGSADANSGDTSLTMVHSATPLKEAITHVGKVLAEEERQGFRNRAVIGGIGPFAREGLAPLRGALPTRAADDTLAGIVGL